MSTYRQGGPRSWGGEIDDEGNRTWNVEYQVGTTDGANDGPWTVVNTPGLPVFGAPWIEGNGNMDELAWFRRGIKLANDAKEGEPPSFWYLTYTASTKPPSKKDGSKGPDGCAKQQIDNPLLQPAKLSGGVETFNEEAAYDRFGIKLTNSAWEQLRGAQVEFDETTDQFKVDINVPALMYDLIRPMVNTVNGVPMWGVVKRGLKLSKFTWDQSYYGTCFPYFTWHLVFDVKLRRVKKPDGTDKVVSGWDRDLLDEGGMVLNGHWDADTGDWTDDLINGLPPNPGDPTHFIRYKDKNGENGRTLLDGKGRPASIPAASHGMYVCIEGNTGEKLNKSNFWLPLSWDGDNKSIAEFSDLTVYSRGAVVYYNGSIFISKKHNPSPVGYSDWVGVGDQFTNRGVWSATEGYTAGDYVDGRAEAEKTAFIHVEKYLESNFLLLNLPVNF